MYFLILFIYLFFQKGGGGGAADTKTQNHFVEKGTRILTAAKCQQTNITKLTNETLKKLVARMNADLDNYLICNEQPNISQKATHNSSYPTQSSGPCRQNS